MSNSKNKESIELEKEMAAKEAVTHIRDHHIVGLGSGTTIYYAIREVGELVQKGMQLKAISTSKKTQELAESFSIPTIDSNSVDHIDVTIDGADEINEDYVLIKGGGGALLREKIVASMSRKQIIIADSSKQVIQLGKAFKLPVEVIPFATKHVENQLELLGGKPIIRTLSGENFLTDEGNWILDVDFGHILDPRTLSDSLNGIVGLVCHGLFIDLADLVIIGSDRITKTEIVSSS